MNRRGPVRRLLQGSNEGDDGGWTRVVAEGWKERTGQTHLYLLMNWMWGVKEREDSVIMPRFRAGAIVNKDTPLLCGD